MFICRINMPYSQHKMTEEMCDKIIQSVQLGDVLLIRTNGELTTLMQPSKWTHSVLVLTQMHAFEATTKGTRLTDLMYILARCDEAMLLRPKFLINNDHMVEYALPLVNRPYDFKFESSDEELYCHEATSKILEHASGVEIPQVDTPLGKKWLPDSFLKSNLFEVIV